MTSPSDSTPICRCRVLYLGSSVPQQTKDGLQGIQQPLRELYPEEGAAGARGIDSWLSVWSNGVLLENVDENHKKITRFFPIESLHYCAAVRYVLVPEKNALHSPTPRFLPLDSPFARTPDPAHPPLFAAILRRTAGIKVLECHAFICKREVAANALVRCCFHAYADSSYAKQVDTAGSIYGTLASERLSTNGKIDDWKTSRSQLGSTTTLNTIDQHSPKDDVSIYNGDENHKVWAGSQDNLDGIYDVYSTGTISRPHRPRQIAQPVAVPPPPPAKDKKKKTKPNAKSTLSGSREDLYNGKAGGSVSGSMHKQRGQHSYAGGPGSNVGGYGSNAGGHGSNVGGYGSNVGGYGSNVGGYVAQHLGGPGSNMGGPQPIYIMAPRPGTLPNPKFFKQHGNTYSHRARGKVLIPARPIPPPMVPMAPVIIPAPTMQKSKKKHAKYAAEEPIYRALSPQMAVNFGHYATVESQGKQKKNHKDKERERSHQAKLNKKLAQSMNGLDDPNLTMNDESPFNTGIYKKKGHLNERAFSYSIRQEHRSRSYGSLANLKFATPIPNGDVEDIREDIKKEREIMQMVQDLDLSGDEIERSEMPQGMYGARGGMIPPGPVIVTASQMNGRGHRR